MRASRAIASATPPPATFSSDASGCIAGGNKNVIALLGQDGSISAKYTYSPFGKQTRRSSNAANECSFGFSSEYLDTESGLVYYNYRYDSPQLGRWLSRDPIGEWGEYNLYNMVDNSPIMSWDDLGTFTTTIQSCNITIFVGHYKAVPSHVKCKPGSAGSVICCWSAGNDILGKKCKKVDKPIPGGSAPDDPIKSGKIGVIQVKRFVKEDFEAGLKYAKTICEDKTLGCKSLTVSVNCDGLSDWDKGKVFLGMVIRWDL